MTTYYCKCGRIVRKSTGANNTGNRLEGYAPGHECFGCPYVLPWGENRYEAGKGYALEVKGYECRMSQSLEYASRFSGSVKDKCTCSIVSLDFDFLERVSNWISATYPGREIFGYFSRSTIRPVEYSSNGRYRMTVTCSQNKAGMAAKAALMERFFFPDGSRKDMTPEQEKEKILNDIKAATHPELPQPYQLGDEYISRKDGRRIRLVDTARDGEKHNWYQIQENLGDGWKPANSSLNSNLEYALSTLAAFVRVYKLVPAPASNEPPEIVDECIGPEEEKEAAPCAANHPNQSPTPSAAPSQSPSPVTAPGASTGTTAPGGKIYITDTGMIYAVRLMQDGVYRIMCHYSDEEWTRTTDPVLRADCCCAESLQEVLDAYALRKGWKEIDMECKEKNPTSGAVATVAGAQIAELPEVSESDSTMEPESVAEKVGASENALTVGAATSDISTPSFDYSGLDAQTVEDLHLAEREYKGGKRLVETGLRRMADGVAIAHDALRITIATKCRNGEGRFLKPEQSFGAWCDSIGLHRKAAERLLQVSELFEESSPKEQKILELLPPSLLYAAAKPSAPAELVQGVKDGEITTHKQYRELLKENQLLRTDRVNAMNRADAAESQRRTALKEKDEANARAETAEAQRDAANARADGLAEEVNAREEKITELLDASEDAYRRAEKAEAERDAARKEKAGLAADCNRIGRKNAELEKELEGSRQVAAAERSRAEHWKEKAEAMTRQAGAAPIEAKVVDADEVERLAAEKAYQMAADMTADQREKAARDAYDAFILAGRSLDALWQSLAPRVPQLDARQRSAAVEPFVQKLMYIKEEVLKCL